MRSHVADALPLPRDSAMMPRSGDEQEVDEFLEVGWSTTNGGYSGQGYPSEPTTLV